MRCVQRPEDYRGPAHALRTAPRGCVDAAINSRPFVGNTVRCGHRVPPMRRVPRPGDSSMRPQGPAHAPVRCAPRPEDFSVRPGPAHAFAAHRAPRMARCCQRGPRIRCAPRGADSSARPQGPAQALRTTSRDMSGATRGSRPCVPTAWRRFFGAPIGSSFHSLRTTFRVCFGVVMGPAFAFRTTRRNSWVRPICPAHVLRTTPHGFFGATIGSRPGVAYHAPRMVWCG